MEPTELIRYQRALKRKNYSAHTVKSYVNILDQFMRWLTVPLSEVTRKEIGAYVDHLLRKRRTPKTITCHLQTIRLFFDYLINEEGIPMVNPVTRISLRLPKPLPRHLKDDQVTRLFAVIKDLRDRAMFMLMSAAAFGFRRLLSSPWMRWSTREDRSLSSKEKGVRTGLST